MSKKLNVAGNEYDSRTVVVQPERLKLPNHPTVNALAIPVYNGKNHAGKLKVVVKIPFGRLLMNTKEIIFEISTPRRIDAINAVVERVKNCAMYRRTEKLKVVGNKSS